MKRKIDTIIPFSGLKSGSYDYHYDLGGDFFSMFENEEILDGSVNFEVKMEKKERVMMLKFVFKGNILTTCDRCLEEMELPVEGEEMLCVKFSDEESSDQEDVVFLPTTAHEIDLAQWMYEYVAVRVPLQKVHPEGGCNPEMEKYIDEEMQQEEVREKGEGEEIDPRWAELLKLKNKNK